MAQSFKTILISGTPGTGKSYLASRLSLLTGFEHFDSSSYIKNSEKYSDFDENTQSFIVNPQDLVADFLKVRDLAMKSGKKGIIFDSHMSHFSPFPIVDSCIVLSCDLKIIQKRLEKRGYSDQKIRENLDSEIFKICETEAIEFGHSPIILNSENLTEDSIKNLVKTL